MTQCRSCTETISLDSIGYNLFPEKENDPDYTHWTEDFLEHMNFWQIGIRLDDDLPKQICETCFQTFSIILNFREQCSSADVTLQEIKHELEKEDIRYDDVLVEEVYVEEYENDSLVNNELEYTSADIDVISVESVESVESDYEDSASEHEVKIEIDTVFEEKEEDVKKVRNSTRFDMKSISNLKPNPLLCTFCFSDKSKDVLYPSEEELKVHQQEEHLDHIEAYKCLICLERFDTSDEAKGHFNACHRIGETCHICGKFVKHLSTNHLQRHVKSTFTCEICGIVMRNCSVIQFEYHKRWHDPKKQFKCSHQGCEKKFVTHNHLKAHMSVHKEFGAFLCTVCGKDFATKFMLKTHTIKNHGANPEIACNICDKVFETYKQKRKHQSEEHPEKITISCENCHNLFPTETGMRLHLRRCQIMRNRKPTAYTRHPPARSSGGSIACSNCTQTFHTESTFLAHQKVHSSDGRPFPCKQCKKFFKTASNLRTHEQLMHGEKQLECEVCGKRFAHGYTLTVHMETHNEDRFECEECGNKFKMRKSLKLHKRIKHTNEKNIKCDYCNEQFKYRQKLYTHLKKAHKFLYEDPKAKALEDK
ncbi:zinc finger protein 345-like [Teleopsis dalmanni]|uniref:zinc finger protein 345-like n=1 Tax=Teleopsis dalmanni TaxID=139649 RepID=UPI0018CCEE18|nr:zinc finger protein 345-like [Teleopsis dalmanni]